MVLVFLWVIIIAVVLIGLMFFVYYNRFVRLRNQIDNSLAQIDVQLRKRGDLVPNLLSSVKGYMKHESKIITEVTNARKVLIGAKDIMKKAKRFGLSTAPLQCFDRAVCFDRR